MVVENVVERGLKRLQKKFESKGFKFKCAFLRESKNYKVWPTGEFRRFGDKSLNMISGGDGQKSLGK